ncbi:uncharacterized protein LOC125513254 isoform X2 [Triticum urartu]|uniref:uncharacterized protein LOC125513254 isoform X2 n=1 Tax=Triticum urartu TaxID=4572 RepID=UPI00204360E8|nr:uncharacterized protein LOC125513254 isoform X2 [Triticum urartu]
MDGCLPYDAHTAASAFHLNPSGFFSATLGSSCCFLTEDYSPHTLQYEEYFPGTLQSEGICKFKCFMAKHVGSLPFLLRHSEEFPGVTSLLQISHIQVCKDYLAHAHRCFRRTAHHGVEAS